MKTKQIILMIMTVIMLVVFSGCANATYSVKLQEEGKIDVAVSVLLNNTEYTFDNDRIEEVKGQFEENGYKIKEISEKGLSGFQITKEDIDLDSKSDITTGNLKADILDDILRGTEFKKGFLGNTYNINSTIDLSTYSYLKSFVITEDDEVISDDDYNKLLSSMNLKLVIELEKGSIISTNSTLTSNKKIAEWVLIPGAVNKIEFNATTGDKMAITGTLIILGVVFVIAVSLLAILFRLYFKKRKN